MLNGIPLSSRREETEQDQLQQLSAIPHGQQGFPSCWHKMVCTPPLVLQLKDPFISPPGTDTAVGLARCHRTHTHKQNKEVPVKSGSGKDIPEAICLAQAVRALCLFARNVPDPRSLLCNCARGKKLHLTAFPNSRQPYIAPSRKEKAFSHSLFKCDVSYRLFNGCTWSH